MIGMILVASTCFAESGWRKLYHASVAAVTAASVADVATSIGKYETNPALRGANGTFGARGIALKAAIAGGSVAIGYLMSRRPRGSVGAATLANFGMAATYGYIAHRNTHFARVSSRSGSLPE